MICTKNRSKTVASLVSVMPSASQSAFCRAVSFRVTTPAVALFSSTASVMSTLPSRFTSPYSTCPSTSEEDAVVWAVVSVVEATVSVVLSEESAALEEDTVVRAVVSVVEAVVSVVLSEEAVSLVVSAAEEVVSVSVVVVVVVTVVTVVSVVTTGVLSL